MNLVTQPISHISFEVISKNYRKVDLMEKHQEYRDRHVPEYWTVEWDCKVPTIIIRTLSPNGLSYRSHSYQSTDSIQSSILPNLSLTVTQIIDAQ